MYSGKELMENLLMWVKLMFPKATSQIENRFLEVMTKLYHFFVMATWTESSPTATEKHKLDIPKDSDKVVTSVDDGLSKQLNG